MDRLAVISVISHDLQDRPNVVAVRNILQHHGYHHVQYIDYLWHGWQSKLEFNFLMCHELTDFTHIMYIDARDVVVLGSPEDVMERWEKFNHPWVCNAEPFIWSPGSFQPEDYPTPDCIYRYLNSGAYIAEREHLVHWFDKWLPSGDIPPVLRGDQDWMAARFIDGYPDAIKLDTDCELFQCLCGSLVGDKPHCTMGPGKVHNHTVGTDPLICHFNGGDDITAPNRRFLWEAMI